MTLKFTQTDINNGTIPILWDQSRVDTLGSTPHVSGVIQDGRQYGGSPDYVFGQYPVFGPTTLVVNNIEPNASQIFIIIT